MKSYTPARSAAWAVAMATLVFAAAGSVSAQQTTVAAAAIQAPAAASVSDVAAHYASGVHASYNRALDEARALEKAIDAFLDNPTTAALEAAKAAWLQAHTVYSVTEVYRFYDGPIDAPESGPEPLINAWPMDEAYVDYVKGDADAGIINMAAEYPTIGEELLVSLNEKGGEKNISTGFHAVEFLLWGQDQSATGPGVRPVSDYLPAENEAAGRRAQYLRLVTDLLVKHLEQVTQAWAPDADNYRAQFMKLDPAEQVRRMLTGIAMMAGDELSQERLVVPMETRDQEDEQSCFSDTTLTALKQDLVGIRQVYTGEFSTVKGPGLAALIAPKDAELDSQIRQKIDEVGAASDQVPLPFDQALRSDDGRKKIEAVVSGLEDLADLLVRAAEALNVKVNLT